MPTCNQSETTNNIGAFRSTTKTAAKEGDQSGMRIATRKKTTTTEGAPEGLPEVTNSIGVLRMTNKTAARERD